MSDDDITPIPIGFCSNCGFLMDHASAVDRKRLPKPKPGDIAICFGCAEVQVFTDDLRVRPINEGELMALSIDDLFRLMILRTSLRAFRATHPPKKDHEA